MGQKSRSKREGRSQPEPAKPLPPPVIAVHHWAEKVFVWVILAGTLCMVLVGWPDLALLAVFVWLCAVGLASIGLAILPATAARKRS